MRNLALAAFAALVLGRTDAQCSVRLINELSEPVALALPQAGTTLDTQQPYSTGGYSPIPCSTNTLAVTVAGQSARIPPVDFTVNQKQTLVAFPTGQLPTAWTAGLLIDASGPMVPEFGNMDMCGLRVINVDAFNMINVNTVTSKCTLNCSKTFYTSVGPLAEWPGQLPSSYNTFPCAAGTLFDLFYGSAQTPYVRTAEIVPWEHGYFTLVLRGPASNASAPFAFLTDAQPPNPYLPLFIAPALLAAAFVAHCIMGAVLARCCAGRFGSGSAESAKDGSAAAGLLSFFGYDKKMARAAAAAASASRADASFGAGGGYSAPLMGEGATAGAGGERNAKPVTSTKPTSAGRVRAIDTLRGLSLFGMIFVNYGAGGYWFLDHAPWNGLHFADLLFPTFVWTQGVSMAISFEAMRRRGASRWDMARRVLQRAVKLYALGCFLNGGASLQNWRLLGVLQYFAMSYMVVGLLEIFVRPAARGAVHAGEASTRAAASSLYAINDGAGSSASRGAGERHEDLASSTVVQSLWRDLGGYWLQWAIMLLIGAVYVCVQTWMAVPGCPSGYIGPGGAADGGAHSQCTGGAHRVVDLKMFTPWHVYHSSDYSGQPVSAATCADVYGCQVYDPEGVLGWISACWMTFLGLQAGRVFTNYKALLAGARDALARRASYRAFLQRWAIWGVVFGLLGASLAGFKQDGGVIPINKNLWSPSFIFTVAGIDFLLMGLLYVVVDLARAWSGAPFAYVGMNSIVVYCGHEILGGYFPFEAYQGGAGYSSHAEFLTSNVFGVLCWVAIARVLYLKKIFINL